MQLSMRRLLFFAIILSPIYSHAQLLLDTVSIDQVQFTARRPVAQLGLVATSIDSVSMSQSGNQNIGELLSLHSPLYIKSYGGSSMATASFRGTAASHTQVIWNGMPINSVSNGISDLSLFPGAFSDQITLLHGGSSLTQGTGSLGGSIILDNRPDWDRPVQICANYGMGSFGTHKLLLGGGFGNAKWQFKIKVFSDHADNNFPYHNDEVLPARTDTLRNGEYLKSCVQQELYGKLGERTLLSFHALSAHADRNLPQLMSYEGNNTESQDDNSMRMVARLQHFGTRWQTSLTSGISTNRSHYQNIVPQRSDTVQETHYYETSLFTRVELKEYFAEKRGIIQCNAGIINYVAETMNLTRATGYKRSRTEFDAGLSVHYRIAERLGGYALLRGEYYDEHTAPLTPSAGIDYQMIRGKDLYLKVTASRNYHKPSLNDLYYMPGGNIDLKPENGYSADAAMIYSYQGKQLRCDASANLYVSRISNWIVWEPATSGASYMEATNLRDVLARGSENRLSMICNHGRWELAALCLYTYTRTENMSPRSANDRSAGKQLMYIPVHTGGLTLSAKYRGVYIGLSHHYTGQRFTTSSNTDGASAQGYQPNLPGYWLTSASAGAEYSHRGHRWSLSLKADNLFATQYKAVLGRPMPLRSLWMSLSWQWAKEKQ